MRTRWHTRSESRSDSRSPEFAATVGATAAEAVAKSACVVCRRATCSSGCITCKRELPTRAEAAYPKGASIGVERTVQSGDNTSMMQPVASSNSSSLGLSSVDAASVGGE
eukprot:scaffold311769_cov32-Tisochrysis_lutea.AAC.3